MPKHESRPIACARLLANVCVLMVLVALAGAVGNVLALAGFSRDAGAALAGPLSVVVACVVQTVLVAHTARRGALLANSRGEETLACANTCHTLAICSVGATIVGVLALYVAQGRLGAWNVATSAIQLGTLVPYWHAVTRLARTSLLRDVGGPDEAELLPPAGPACAALALDEDTGMLRAAADGEHAHVRVMTLSEYLAQVPGRVVQQVARAAGMPGHCSCSAIGDATFGSVFIPTEAQVAAGLSAGADIGFSYHLTDERLTLVMEEGPARSLLAFYLSDQYLHKREPAAVLYELFDTLLHDASVWLGDRESRLERLERGLSDNVRELPRDFNEYVGDTRRKLGVLMRFYKQVGDMFEDLAETGGVRTGLETSQLLRALANRSHRLAGDTAALREHVAEIRMSYQERIDVRQNSVISLFTILTTVFASLSLVTGWYGMNFDDMPGMGHPDAYYVVVAVVVAVVTAETAYFKKRNWF